MFCNLAGTHAVKREKDVTSGEFALVIGATYRTANDQRSAVNFPAIRWQHMGIVEMPLGGATVGDSRHGFSMLFALEFYLVCVLNL